MVQRLGLAVACLADAEVLVLDEPTVGLDPESAARLRDLLAAQKHEGKTIVFSSHVLSDVERLADRIAVLDAGRLVALETAAGLGERRARSGRLRVSLGSVSRAVVDAARRAGADDAALDGRDLVVVCRPDRRVDVLGAVAAAGGPITGFETREPTLEDLYLRGWNA
jgi:ABC-type multidrug transport system ATPase subunit